MWMAQFFQIFPQVVLVPYLIRKIGEEGYGVYALIWALILSIDQLEKSSQSGVVKYSAAFLIQGLSHEVNKVVSTSFIYSIFLGILACIGVIMVAPHYKDSTGQVYFSLIVVGIMILLITPLTPYIAVIQSQQRYYVNAIADTAYKYISLFVIMLWFNIAVPSVNAVILITACALFCARLAQVPIAYRFVPGLRNSPRFYDLTRFRQIASFGLAMVLVSACTAMNTTGVRWLMDMLVSTRFVAHLAIMLMPAMLLSQAIEAATITVMPATSAYEATGNQRMLQELLLRGMRYTTILGLAGLLAAVILVKYVLNLWVGPEYEFLAPFVLVLFAFRSFMLSTSTAHHMLRGLGQLGSVMFIYVTGLVIVPIGTIFAMFKGGVDPYIAVTAGLSIGYVVYGCLQIGFCTRTVGANLGYVLLHAYAQSFSCAAVVFFLSHIAVTFCGFNNLFVHIAISVVSIILFLTSFYCFCATSAERRQVEELFQLAVYKISVIVGMKSVHQ
ncbi:MAG: hypothetical protein JW832_04420 [Deltaproteobacteria bacterium]|nr:hypothetical protein [Deltaproteobacteria bacterium]